MKYLTVSNHTESFLTSSTIDNLINRFKELGSGYFVSTDDGVMVSSVKSYYASKKAGLKFIGGVDAYFLDKNCNIIENTQSSSIKYFKLVILAPDQDVYQELVKIVSDFSDTITVDEQQMPIFNWQDLEKLASLGAVVCSSGIEDMVSKHTLVGEPKNSLKYYKKLKEMFKDNYHPCITIQKYEGSFSDIVEVSLSSGETIQLEKSARVVTNKSGRLKASDLHKQKRRHSKILSFEYNKVMYSVKECKQGIEDVFLRSVYRESSVDVQKEANKLLIGLANKFGDLDRLLINHNSYYSSDKDSIVQRMKTNSVKPVLTKQFIKSEEEVEKYLEYLGFGNLKGRIANNYKCFLSKFDDFELKYSYRLVKYDNPEKIIKELIKKNGRMVSGSAYSARLKEEWDIIANNGVINLLPYFIPITEVIEHYKKNGEIIGVARGSAGGSLLSYLIGVTNVDPIKYGLSFSRFLTLDRISQNNLPDIDLDLISRDLLVGSDGNGGFLKERFGNSYAQCSTRTLLRIKSAMLDANRYINGELDDDVVRLSKSLPNTPQGASDYEFIFGFEKDGTHVPGLLEQNEELQQYVKDRPKEWEIVKRAVSLSRQNSRHACAFILADTDIENVVPVMPIGSISRVTQPEHKQCEQVGLIKYDFLVITSAKFINDAINLINKRHGDVMETGYFKHKGEKLFIWDLPSDPSVYYSLTEGETAGVFQFSSSTMTEFLKKTKPTKILDLSAVNALNRPGPLDFIDESTGRNMAEEWVERKNGRSKGKYDILDKLLPDTYGVICYQEDITLLAKELAGMNVEDSENLRIAVGKKKKKLMESLEPVFIEGASNKVNKKEAKEIWDMIVTFGRYGFNKSHSVSYSIISYTCAFLKQHYPLEWWASVLSNSSDKKINEEYYMHIKDIVSPPDINKSGNEIVIDYEDGKIRYKLSIISGFGEKTSKNLIDARPYNNIVDFIERSGLGVKKTKQLASIGVLDSLFIETNTLVDNIYEIDKGYLIKERNKKLLAYDKKILDAETDKLKDRAIKNKERFTSKPLKEVEVDDEYLGIKDVDLAILKKQLIPAFPAELTNIIIKNHKLIYNESMPVMLDTRMNEVKVISGFKFNEIENSLPFGGFSYWVIGFVIDANLFSYHNNTKQAFKMVVDCDGVTNERVIWPNYDSGKLMHDKSIGKGKIIAMLMVKKENKERVSLYETKVLY